MKKLLFYATALLSLATAIGGCTAEDVIDLLIPDITIKQPGIYPGEGGEYSIAYTLDNPRAGVAKSAKSTERWISDLSVDGKKVSFYLSANPTTFICGLEDNDDWCYNTGSDLRWGRTKTIYDPCPPGYKIPDGGDNGIWAKVLGSKFVTCEVDIKDEEHRGMDLGKSSGSIYYFTSSYNCWYPVTFDYSATTGIMNRSSTMGSYWSHTAKDFNLDINPGEPKGIIDCRDRQRASGRAVRCQKE